jgi:hypothetical protein
MTMTLLQILDKLPPAKAVQLEQLLDRAAIPEEPTKVEVLSVVQTLVGTITAGEADEVVSLLNQAPQAVVDQLFTK